MQLTAWMDLACVVLEALAAHAFRWDKPAYERFRQSLEESLKLLKSQPSPSAVLISAGTLSQRIEHYHQHIQKAVDGSISELHDIIRVLLSAIEEVHLECSDSATALEDIKETIENTSTAEELQVAKAHLTHALGLLGEKTRERREKISELVTNLQERVLTLDRSFPAGPARLSEVLPSMRLKPPGETGEGGEPPSPAQETESSCAPAAQLQSPSRTP